jgi:hypothetical protein
MSKGLKKLKKVVRSLPASLGKLEFPVAEQEGNYGAC